MYLEYIFKKSVCIHDDRNLLFRLADKNKQAYAIRFLTSVNVKWNPLQRTFVRYLQRRVSFRAPSVANILLTANQLRPIFGYVFADESVRSHPKNGFAFVESRLDINSKQLIIPLALTKS